MLDMEWQCAPRGGGHHGPGHHGGGGRHGRRHGGGDGFGRGGRGGRVFGPGDLRLALLALVAEEPRHGYELIKEIEQRFGGAYAPSPGSVYPTLTLLEELGQLGSTVTEGSKRRFEITEAGRTWLAENKAAVDGVMQRMALAARAMTGDTPPDEIFEAMHTLKAALRFHGGSWDAAETARVRAILVRAAREIGPESGTAGEAGDDGL